MKELDIQLELIKEIVLDIEIKKDIIQRVSKMMYENKKDCEVYSMLHDGGQLMAYVDAYDIDKEEKLIYQFCQMI
ncbi:MAG: hypothetical protein ACLPWD_06555 [Methanobacterium sp.]